MALGLDPDHTEAPQRDAMMGRAATYGAAAQGGAAEAGARIEAALARIAEAATRTAPAASVQAEAPLPHAPDSLAPDSPASDSVDRDVLRGVAARLDEIIGRVRGLLGAEAHREAGDDESRDGSGPLSG